MLAAAALWSLAAGTATGQTPVPPPVAAVGDGRFSVSEPAGTGILSIYTSQDWSQPLSAIRRVVIIVHGYERNAADYARMMLGLVPDPAATLVLTPQFLAAEDVAAHNLPDTMLRWQRGAWEGGNPADGPAPLSAFDALDALLGKAADRRVLPNLSQIVLVGFSAGGQLVQRYAVVGRGEGAFGRGGIDLRYVVGSPSSYLYFTEDRPRPEGGFGPFAEAAACPNFNHWKYGLAGDLPRYVQPALQDGAAALEHRYIERDIVYLVGARDDDPNHRFLDKSCAAEAQGSMRLARIQSFFQQLKQRDSRAFKQQMWVIDDAAHNAARVLGSPCGRAALFDTGGCPDK